MLSTSLVGSYSNSLVRITNQTKSKTSGDPTAARVGVQFTTTGHYQTGVGTTAVSYSDVEWPGQYLLLGSNSDYEVMASTDSGDDPTTGTLDTWQVMSAQRTWEWVQSGVGTLSGVLHIYIRLATSHQVIANCTFTATATVI